MISRLKKIVDCIYKDVKDENESKKSAVILRILGLVMCVYFSCIIVIFIAGKDYFQVAISILCLLAHIGAIALTYHDQTYKAMWLVNISMLSWIVFLVLLWGWDIGVQHFLFVLVILYYLSSYDKKIFKIIYTLALCCLRLWLYCYCRENSPKFAINDTMSVAFQFLNTIAIFVDISIISLVFSKGSQEMEKKLVVYNKKLRVLASIDELTGLYNRRNMMERLEDMERQKYARSCSIAIGDIDFFKKVNDNYGHDCGDVVLQRISELMNTYMADKGFIARWGGEEFLLLFEEANGDQAYDLLFGLLKKIRALKIEYEGYSISITMTFGLTEYCTNQGINAIIKEADDKLYKGKATGRNQIIY